MYRVAFGLFWVVLCCVVGVWIGTKLLRSALGLLGFALGVFWLLLVCREIAKIIKSVMAITELKKNGSKKEIQARSKLLKPLDLLGLALSC